jgi:peptidoglycan/LPS O-acetylase OafA/YrhL
MASEENPLGSVRCKSIQVQQLRGIAVLAVVFFHLEPNFFPNGYLGVDVFFVISGYVMAPLLFRTFAESNLKPSLRLAHFFRRRFFRLFPAAGVTITVFIFLMLTLSHIWEHPRTFRQAIAALLLWGNLGAYRYSAGNYFDPNPNPLIHYWSLSAEEQIYVIVPLLVLLMNKIVQNNALKSVLILCTIVGPLAQIFILPSFFEWLKFSNVDGINFFSPFSYLWKFSLGGMLYFYREHLTRILPMVIKKYLYLFSWVLVICVLFSPSAFKYAEILVVFLALFLLIFDGDQSKGKFGFHWLVKLGDISYSVYLVHWPVIYVMKWSPFLVLIPNQLGNLISLGLIAIAALTLFKTVEDKFRLKSSSVENSLTFRRAVVVFWLVPLFLSVAGLQVVTKTSGTLVRSEVPVYSGENDKSCDRLLTGEPCVYKVNNSKGTAVLFGDSVAMALADVFIESAHRSGFQAITFGLAGCQFIESQSVNAPRQSLLIEQFSRPWGENQVSCFDHNAKISAFLKRIQPDFVFYSQHSIDDSYEESLGIGKTDLLNLRVKNLKNLSENINRLEVIGAPPLYAQSELMPTPTTWKLVTGRKSIPVNELESNYIHDDKRMRAELFSESIGYNSIVDLFCTKEVCRSFENGRWLYRDQSHLSLEGAAKLNGMLQDLFALKSK